MSTTASRPGPSFGDVNATLTTCVLPDSNGDTCGRPGMPGLPLGCCEQHAMSITRAVLKLGGITIEER